MTTPSLLAAIQPPVVKGVIRLTDRVIAASSTDPDLASATLNLSSSGALIEARSQDGANTSVTVADEWQDPHGFTAGGSFEVRATFLSGDPLNTANMTGFWMNLAISRVWRTLRDTVGTSSSELFFEIRLKDTQAILASATISLTATVTSI